MGEEGRLLGACSRLPTEVAMMLEEAFTKTIVRWTRDYSMHSDGTNGVMDGYEQL